MAFLRSVFSGLVKIIFTNNNLASNPLRFLLYFTGMDKKVNWRDGSMSTITNGVFVQHTYATQQVRQVYIYGRRLNDVTRIESQNENNIAIDIRNLTGVNYINFIANTNLVSLLLPNQITDKLIYFHISQSNLTSLDLSNIPVSGFFSINSCNLLQTITFSTTNNALITTFDANAASVLKSLDLSNVPIRTTFAIGACFQLSTLIFSTTGNLTVSNFRADNCDKLPVIDCSNVPLSGTIRCNGSAILTNFIFKTTGNGALTSFNGAFCQLVNLSFDRFNTSNNVSIDLRGNNMTVTEVDNQLQNLDGTGWINGVLYIHGTNDTPTRDIVIIDSIDNGGSGYNVGNVLTITGGGGAGAQITVDSVDGSGAILTASITAGGSGYTSQPTGYTGGDGAGADFTVFTYVLSLQNKGWSVTTS